MGIGRHEAGFGTATFGLLLELGSAEPLKHLAVCSQLPTDSEAIAVQAALGLIQAHMLPHPT